MSDSNVEGTNSENSKNEETSSSDKKASLVSVTHKLKAEALRRYKIDDEIGNEATGTFNIQDAEDSNSDSDNLKAHQLDNQLHTEDVKQRKMEEDKEDEEYASLSIGETLNNDKKSIGSTKHGTNSIQSNKSFENENISKTTENIQDSKDDTDSNKNLQMADLVNVENKEASDYHTIDLSNDKVPESSVPDVNTTNQSEELATIEKKEGKTQNVTCAIGKDTSNEVEDQKPEFSDKSMDDGLLQSTTNNNNGKNVNKSSELVDCTSEVKDQSETVQSTGQVNFNISGSHGIKVSDADKDIMQSALVDQDMGSESAEVEDFIKNQHSVQISNDMKTEPEEEALTNKNVESTKPAVPSQVIAVDASSDEFHSNVEPGENVVSSSTEQTEYNNQNKILEENTPTNASSVDAQPFEGNMQLVDKIIAAFLWRRQCH